MCGATGRFLEIMHEAIQAALRDGVDEVQKNGAIQTQEGWMHIHGACPPGPWWCPHCIR